MFVPFLCHYLFIFSPHILHPMLHLSCIFLQTFSVATVSVFSHYSRLKNLVALSLENMLKLCMLPNFDFGRA